MVLESVPLRETSCGYPDFLFVDGVKLSDLRRVDLIESLPRPLCYSIAFFNGIEESLVALQCSKGLHATFKEQVLWRQHALNHQYFQHSGLSPLVQDGSPPEVSNFFKYINWRLLVKINSWSTRPRVTVRVRDFDICLRLPPCGAGRLEALCQQLHQILGGTVQGRTRPFRLRYLQWGGRPGLLAEARKIAPGSRLFLEWAQVDLRCWPLPPQFVSTEGLLLRIVSSLLQQERWLQLHAESSLMRLLDEIAEIIRQDCPSFLERPIHFRLMDMQPPDAHVGEPTLAQLALAQSETLCVEVTEKAMRGAPGADPWDLVLDLKREPAFAFMKHGLGDAASSSDDVLTGGTLGQTAPARARREELGVPESSERIVPHYLPVCLKGSEMSRQFEFHPCIPDVILVGDKHGTVKILSSSSEPQGSEVAPPLQVDRWPLLALSWMRHDPYLAVCGVSNSGQIEVLRYRPNARPGKPVLAKTQSSIERFPKLSSLSVNCSDNFLLASGISSSISIYDIGTGKVISKGNAVHDHFINISRFSNSSPHIFATASFDDTCKIWDLRQPLRAEKPVKTLYTGSHNVMCTFSPDDRLFLCCGIDTHLTQFQVPSWKQTPCRMPLRPQVHQERYRRAAYLANGKYFVTGSTEESHIHFISTEGKKLGVVDLRGLAQARQDSDLSVVSNWQPKQLFGGAVCLDDAQPNSGSSLRDHEFVQSIRAHPVLHNRIGILMAKPKAVESYIALLDVDSCEIST
eukprot:TRINITY_DN76197_c0_g1_i1.p1 TRINITY_DN76197_c0_g1~~TRINITY_DN76197_c0_g1_i1.p1  ORF type:complete len:744 (+),score=93.45 TRINITY_DN76197_c0_g1_i1:132-2363(+)